MNFYKKFTKLELIYFIAQKEHNNWKNLVSCISFDEINNHIENMEKEAVKSKNGVKCNEIKVIYIKKLKKFNYYYNFGFYR